MVAARATAAKRRGQNALEVQLAAENFMSSSSRFIQAPTSAGVENPGPAKKSAHGSLALEGSSTGAEFFETKDRSSRARAI